MLAPDIESSFFLSFKITKVGNEVAWNNIGFYYLDEGVGSSFGTRYVLYPYAYYFPYYGKEINQYLELSAHPFTLLNVYFDENGVVILGRQPLEGSSKVATWTTPEKRLNKLVATELHVFEKSGYFCSIFQGNHRHTPFLNSKLILGNFHRNFEN